MSSTEPERAAVRVGVSIEGDLGKILDDEARDIARSLRDGMQKASRALQQDLRDQTKAGLPRGSNVANAWRERVYPTNPLQPTLRPSALVWTKTPDIIDAFDKGKAITVRGAKYLCWPTGYNATGGRRGAGRRGGMKVTPEQMVAAKGQSVIIPAKRRGTFLWCLRVRQQTSRTPRGRTRSTLIVGNLDIAVNTGRGRAADKQARAKQLLGLGLAPMFFLQKQVNPGKRLDVDAAAVRAEANLYNTLLSELGRG